jgi:hypothetical protein
MAGITKLQAVTRIVRTIGHGRPPNLDTNGASPVAFAEDILDEVTRRYLGRGLEENVVRAKMFTLANDGTLTLPDLTLDVRGAGPDEHRKFSVRNLTLWDVSPNKNSDVIGSAGDKVCLHWTFNLTWGDVQPNTQEAITNEAALEFQRRYRSSPEQDAYLNQEAVKTDVVVRREVAPADKGPSNAFPTINSAGTSPQGQGGG